MHPRRPLHRHHHKLPTRPNHLLSSPNRPRNSPIKRLVHRSPPPRKSRAPRPLPRPPKPPSSRRPHQPKKIRPRRLPVAPTQPSLPLYLRSPPNLRKSKIHPLDNPTRKNRNAKSPADLPKPTHHRPRRAKDNQQITNPYYSPKTNQSSTPPAPTLPTAKTGCNPHLRNFK